uniref:Uncharacterized protein n=1 Tax=Chromera velia CCMP2878 TaxID=1169474 RepID=A0A0G4HAH1_9ALVE|eukprot:Cvel_25540.t1-p1 / transcript=Cvel_25540.t1 / gene=Cvel_25540 / organism=Chromera_velia_CCMP2878 / gene_product=Coiled-coil domain-containing protein C16orf93, putative / transcript_product=Coiled-coil domain-containing protein C16orf93, putative / location=Cvel_scaffold2907:9696-10676(+) / protein_length=221 / sequence_SO=supercontig / SO=protein_coding / is_pseudo=false
MSSPTGALETHATSLYSKITSKTSKKHDHNLFLTFRDVSKTDLEEAFKSQSKEVARAVLDRCFKVREQDQSFRADIVSDFLLNALLFCISKQMTFEKTSTFLSLLHETLHESVVARLSPGSSFDFFKKLLLQHCIQRPPFSVGVFSHQDLQEVQNYAMNTFFRHYKLYQYVYVTHQVLIVKQRRPLLLSVPAPAPLSEDLPEIEEDEEVLHLLSDPQHALN